jgi:ferritin-like metal-binding protein YciE
MADGLSKDDHDLLISMKQMLISYMENNTKQITDLQTTVNRFTEQLSNKQCEADARITVAEKDIIRLQGADSALQAGIVAQGTAISTQAGIFKTATDGLDARLKVVETSINKDIPKDIDDTLKEKKQDDKDATTLKWNKYYTYLTAIGTAVAVLAFLVGWYGHP